MFMIEFKTVNPMLGEIVVYGHFDNKANAEKAIKDYVEEGIKYGRKQSAKFV